MENGVWEQEWQQEDQRGSYCTSVSKRSGRLNWGARGREGAEKPTSLVDVLEIEPTRAETITIFFFFKFPLNTLVQRLISLLVHESKLQRGLSRDYTFGRLFKVRGWEKSLKQQV